MYPILRVPFSPSPSSIGGSFRVTHPFRVQALRSGNINVGTVNKSSEVYICIQSVAKEDTLKIQAGVWVEHRPEDTHIMHLQGFACRVIHCFLRRFARIELFKIRHCTSVFFSRTIFPSHVF